MSFSAKTFQTSFKKILFQNKGETYKKKTYYITELLDEHPNYDSGLGFYWDMSMEHIGNNITEAKKGIRDSVNAI